MRGSGCSAQVAAALAKGAPVSQIANGAEISVLFPFLTRLLCRDVRSEKKRKKRNKNYTFEIQDCSKGGNEIEKPNTTSVESQYLQIAQTQSLFN